MTHTTKAVATVPGTFMIFDEAGKVWPPGFQSQLCNPLHPNSILRTLKQQQAQHANRKAREKVAESGEGWANGYMGPLSGNPAKVDVYSTHTPRMRKEAHGTTAK